MLNNVSTFWGRIAPCCLCELVELFGHLIPWPGVNIKSRDRVFNSWRTFWLFLAQVLSASQTCREALRKGQAWLLLQAHPDKKKKSHLIRRLIVSLAVDWPKATWMRSIDR